MARSNDNVSPDKINRICEGTVIQGEIKSNGNVRIDGVLKGTITTSGRLVIGPQGQIEGDVICQNADIEGQLTGKITVSELLSLKTTAKLNGDIITGKLAIEPGAVFTGSCAMGAVVKDMKNANNLKHQKEKTA